MVLGHIWKTLVREHRTHDAALWHGRFHGWKAEVQVRRRTAEWIAIMRETKG
jgi:hypothetical protein